MSEKKSRELRKKSKLFFMEWIKTILPDEEDTSKLTFKNMHELLPDDTHYFANGRVWLSAYTPRWFNKKLKKNPNLTVEEIINETESSAQKTGNDGLIL